MTSEEHASGTDRIAEAAKKIDLPLNTLILNLQGDEPFMPLQIINKLPMLISKDAPITTACIRFNEKMDINNPNEVKVVRSKSKKAIYFSRSVIPNSFTFDYKNENNPCLKCFYQTEPSDEILNCEYEGVLGTVAGIVGIFQANEILKKISKKTQQETV